MYEEQQELQLDAERFLAMLGDRVSIPAEALTDPATSAAYLATARSAPASGKTPEPVAHVKDLTIDGDIAVRTYRPDADRLLPVVVYFHGGGWVTGDLEMHDATCRALANRTPCVVVNVDYRLAPEHPFPAPLDDAITAVHWAARNAQDLGGDAGKLAVAGSSSGGNLAAAAALLTRETGPPIALQALVYPVLDAAMETESYREFADGYLISRNHMAWYWQQYVPDPARRTDHLASPLRAPSVEGLPTTIMITAGCDPLRDEGEAYARRLADSGIVVESIRFDGQVHGFLGYPEMIANAGTALTWLAERLTDHLGQEN